MKRYARLNQLLKLPIGMNAGAFARREMACLGDAMVCIGGDEGVEHFARILLDNRKNRFSDRFTH
jgi:hypothetical protein